MSKLGQAFSGGMKAVREAVVRPMVNEAKATTGDVLKTFELGSTTSSNSNPQTQNQTNPVPNSQLSTQKTEEEQRRLMNIKLSLRKYQESYDRQQQLNALDKQKKEAEEQESIQKKNVIQFEKREQQKKAMNMMPAGGPRNPELAKKKG